MIAFEVSLNGKQLTVAGAEDLGGLSVIMSGAGKLGPLTVDRRKQDSERDINLHVGGLTSRDNQDNDVFLDWVKSLPLNVGDEVFVRVLEIEDANKPVSSRPLKQFDYERELFEYAKKNYFELREKYEKATGDTP